MAGLESTRPPRSNRHSTRRSTAAARGPPTATAAVTTAPGRQGPEQRPAARARANEQGRRPKTRRQTVRPARGSGRLPVGLVEQLVLPVLPTVVSVRVPVQTVETVQVVKLVGQGRAAGQAVPAVAT